MKVVVLINLSSVFIAAFISTDAVAGSRYIMYATEEVVQTYESTDHTGKTVDVPMGETDSIIVLDRSKALKWSCVGDWLAQTAHPHISLVCNFKHAYNEQLNPSDDITTMPSSAVTGPSYKNGSFYNVREVTPALWQLDESTGKIEFCLASDNLPNCAVAELKSP